MRSSRKIWAVIAALLLCALSFSTLTAHPARAEAIPQGDLGIPGTNDASKGSADEEKTPSRGGTATGKTAGEATTDGGGTTSPEKTSGGGDTTGGNTTGIAEEQQGSTDGLNGQKCSLLDMKCHATQGFIAILGWIFKDGVQAGIKEVGDDLAKSAFGLPKPSGELSSRYNGLVEAVKPGILVGILLLGLMMMLRSANYNVAYSTQHGLPKLVFVAGAFVFFPEFMDMVSDLSGGMAKGFLGEAEMADAVRDLIVAGLQNGGPLSIFTIVGEVAVLGMGALVVAVAIFKNIAFSILFVAGPLALIFYPVPGLSNITGAWFRGIVACAAIPLLYSIEIMVGSWIVKAPELVFGSAGAGMSVFKILSAVMLLWVMWKTPFKVLEWAFYSYGGGGRSVLSSIARGVAVAGVTAGLGRAAGALLGGSGPSPPLPPSPPGGGRGPGGGGALPAAIARARVEVAVARRLPNLS